MRSEPSVISVFPEFDAIMDQGVVAANTGNMQEAGMFYLSAGDLLASTADLGMGGGGAENLEISVLVAQHRLERNRLHADALSVSHRLRDNEVTSQLSGKELIEELGRSSSALAEHLGMVEEELGGLSEDTYVQSELGASRGVMARHLGIKASILLDMNEANAAKQTLRLQAAEEAEALMSLRKGSNAYYFASEKYHFELTHLRIGDLTSIGAISNLGVHKRTIKRDAEAAENMGRSIGEVDKAIKSIRRRQAAIALASLAGSGGIEALARNRP